jgi:hypothetical protein
MAKYRPHPKSFFNHERHEKAQTFLELGWFGDRIFQKFCCNPSQWKQKANSD